jgi:hypothetical protein
LSFNNIFSIIPVSYKATSQSKYMKKTYSAILLVSFFVGIAQPVIPMAEYHLQKGDLFELLSKHGEENRNKLSENFCSHDKDTLSDDRQDKGTENLIDIEFYPVPIKPNCLHSRVILPVLHKGYPFTDRDLTEQFLKKYKPPPRLS